MEAYKATKIRYQNKILKQNKVPHLFIPQRVIETEKTIREIVGKHSPPQSVGIVSDRNSLMVIWPLDYLQVVIRPFVQRRRPPGHKLMHLQIIII